MFATLLLVALSAAGVFDEEAASTPLSHRRFRQLSRRLDGHHHGVECNESALSPAAFEFCDCQNREYVPDGACPAPCNPTAGDVCTAATCSEKVSEPGLKDLSVAVPLFRATRTTRHTGRAL